MNFKKRIASALATGAILLNLATPAYANVNITISGNAQNSSNDANVTMSQNTVVAQNNTANVVNNVDADADTGNNDANGNNGGNVSITTGNANVSVNVTNTLNKNAAQVDCCPKNGNTTIEIKDNAQNTTNNATLNSTSNITVAQNNDADVRNNIKFLDADTGDNDANGNNGGDVTITTGSAKVKVDVNTTANQNWAKVGGSGSNATGNVNLTISNNAQNSTNDIGLWLDSLVLISQNNDADITNNVDADADTGDNDANGNNGGDVTITTGNASVDVDVDNNINFNWASSDCGCLFGDVKAKVADNAQDSGNNILAKLFSDTLALQFNDGDLDNNVKFLDADTGDNDSNNNNAGGTGDPKITTGHANSDVDVSNGGNVNLYGVGSLPSFPSLGLGGGSVTFSFSLAQILALLGGSGSGL